MILGVNIDHVATLREARKGHEPDPLMAAPLAILGGADGITVHLREDRRHINDRDLHHLREMVRVELNLEMAATDEMLKIAIKTRPDMVTIVPEHRKELTTEGGLGLKQTGAMLSKAVKTLHKADIPVSFFINPSADDVRLSKSLGADMVELHTGLYANAKGTAVERELGKILAAVEAGVSANILINAGHGLNYTNVQRIARIDCIRGLYIGHSIISRAVFSGLELAVREMKAIVG